MKKLTQKIIGISLLTLGLVGTSIGVIRGYNHNSPKRPLEVIKQTNLKTKIWHSENELYNSQRLFENPKEGLARIEEYSNNVREYTKFLEDDETRESIENYLESQKYDGLYGFLMGSSLGSIMIGSVFLVDAIRRKD